MSNPGKPDGGETPECDGYPKCDGDLPGEPHEPTCPAAPQPSAEATERCHAQKDGDCNWKDCPQEANNRANYQSTCPLACFCEDDDGDNPNCPTHRPAPSAEATSNLNVTKDWIENKQLENGDPNFFRKQILGEWPSGPAPSGETRGTPEKVCDWKADGWTIDPKILGEIEDDPRVRAEGDPGLEMVEAILLAADWEPLAPEATTKEPPNLGANEYCPTCGKPMDVNAQMLVMINLVCYHEGCEVAPGEAVGTTRFADFDDDDHPFRKWWEDHGQFMLSGGGRRESIWAARGWIAREQLGFGAEVTGDSMHEEVEGEAVGREQRFEKLSKQYGWERYERADISELLDFAESTLRRTS